MRGRAARTKKRNKGVERGERQREGRAREERKCVGVCSFLGIELKATVRVALLQLGIH